MNDAADTDLSAFRGEVKAWPQDNVSASLKGRDNVEGEAPVSWEGDAYSEDELAAVRSYLGVKALVFAGGSTKIQHNIIARRILGLPNPNSQAS